MEQENFTPVGIGRLISSQDLLRYGPPTQGLFTGDGTIWARLKQGERIREYKTPPHITAAITNIADSVLHLCFETESKARERRTQGIYYTIPGE